MPDQEQLRYNPIGRLQADMFGALPGVQGVGSIHDPCRGQHHSSWRRH